MALPDPSSSSGGQTRYSVGVSSSLAQVNLWDPSYALQSDDEVLEKLTRDPVVAGSLDQLQRLVVGHDWFYEPADDTRQDRGLATILERLQKQTYRLSSALYNLSSATFKGAAWAQIKTERRVLRLGDGKPREWTVVARVRDVDKRRFLLSRLSPEPTATQDRWTPADPGAQRSVTHPIAVGSNAHGAVGPHRWMFYPGYSYEGRGTGLWTPLETIAPADRWIQHVVDDSERGLGYGYGLAEDLYFYYWCKQKILTYGMQGLERWGQGFLSYRVSALMNGLSKGTTQAAAQAAAVAAMKTWRSNNFAAIGKDDELQLLDMPATAASECREWVAYFDREIVKRILVALQPTGGGDGAGSYSSSKVEESSTDAAVAYLRGPLEETWTRSVAGLLVRENADNLAELGYAGLEVPRLRLRGKEHHDLDQVIRLFDLAARIGAPVKREDFYSMTGLGAPNEDDEIMEWPAAPSAATGLGGPLDRAAVGEI